MTKYKTPQEWLEKEYPDKNQVEKIDLSRLDSEQHGELVIDGYSNLKKIGNNGFFWIIHDITKLTITNCPQLEIVSTFWSANNQQLILNNLPNLKELNCFLNSLTTLDLTNCPNLQIISCEGNKLTEIKLPKGEKLEKLRLSVNKLNQDLSFLKDLKNLKVLSLGNNPLYGSLKPLRNMKLGYLDIMYTEVNDGLEYLSEDLASLYCNDWCAKLLKNYKKDNNSSDYNYQAWRKDNLYLINKINSLEKQLTGNQTIIDNLQCQLNETTWELNNTNMQLNSWKVSFFWPQLSWNQPDSVVTFRTQVNSFDLIGTVGLSLLARHLYRKYRDYWQAPQDEERQPLLRTPEIERLNQKTRHLNLELNQARNIAQQKQTQLAKIARIVSPYQEPEFSILQQEITHLKYQELAPQVRKKKEKLEQLITAAKTKAGSSEKTIDLLLETQKQAEQTNSISRKDKLNGKIEAYQDILKSSLTQEEIQSLLVKKKELLKLEEHLSSLQKNQEQLPQILHQPYGTPGSSKNPK